MRSWAIGLKLPAFLAAHPVESMIAVGLLLGLLFISADGTAPLAAPKPVLTISQGH
jgi:hypothetical protein